MYDSDLIKVQGLDDAVVGVVETYEGQKLAYDYDKCIKIYQKQGMSLDMAREYFDFNVVGNYVGVKSPVFLYKDTLKNIENLI
tara:strand:+ start:2336 stop:2584 length:249 start_codon:yes stop_codon:yes gene_type:complete